jgi:uncharacterized membrane protein YsdA (DUF1294 family)
VPGSGALPDARTNSGRAQALLEQSQARQPISGGRIYTPIHDRNGKTFLLLKNIDSFAAIWFAVFNVVTFIAFGFDKWRASGSKQRISEFSLALLGALGGWPGGLLGMNVFRHKTAKLTFKLKYALALIPFAAEIWAFLHWR